MEREIIHGNGKRYCIEKDRRGYFYLIDTHEANVDDNAHWVEVLYRPLTWQKNLLLNLCDDLNKD